MTCQRLTDIPDSIVGLDDELEAIGQNTRWVSRVSAQAWPEEMANGIYPGKRVVQWNWTLKNTQERKLVCASI